MSQPFDVILENSAVFDGSGSPRRRANVGVKHGKFSPEVGRARGLGQVLRAEHRGNA